MSVSKFYTLFFFQLFFGLHIISAQSTDRVDRIQELLSGIHTNPIERDGLLFGKKLIKRTDENKVCYLGLQLFQEDMKKQMPSHICDFLESYLLELALLPNRNMMNNVLVSNHVEIMLENVRLAKQEYTVIDLLALITDQSPFRIRTEPTTYTAEWTTTSNGKITFTFPKRYELIFGKDKKSMEDELIRRLRVWKVPATTEPVIDKRQLKASAHSSVWYLPGSYYYLPGVNNNTYFESDDSHLNYVFSDKHIAESITNLFTSADYMNLHTPVHIVQRMYGNNSRTWGTDISVLLSFFRSEGCEIFTGIETYENGNISGSVFFVNSELGYNHLMYYEVPVDAVRKKDTPVAGVFYAYVPTHNINRLFGVHKTNDISKVDQGE